MTDPAPDRPPGNAGGNKPPRRQRYRGTHPRHFHQKYKELAGEPGILEHIRHRGRTPAGTHVPVLLKEVLAAMDPRPGQIVADCTVGYGGHAAAMLQRIGPAGRLVGFDLDAAELERTRRRLAEFGEAVHLHHRNYAGIAGVMAEEHIDGFDVIFADIGVSSMQVDDPARGFSYKHEQAPLDMRMDDRVKETAADLLGRLGEQELATALSELSDEPDAQRIAAFIVQRQQVAPLATTGQLIDLIFAAKGTTAKAWKKRASFSDLHPAARTFQALRILVNDELASLRELLRVAPYCLRSGGRIGIISFHSGEDRLVKRTFADGLAGGVYRAISDHVIRPSGGEVHANPRSASAKFRWAVRT